MSIYDEKPLSFDFGKSKSLISTIVLLLLVLLAVVIVLIGVSNALEKKPIELNWVKNPITLNEETTILNAKITNITQVNAKQVQVTAKPVGIVPIILTVERNGLIGSMAPGEERRIKILVNPTKEILPGNYLIKITTRIGSREYTKNTTLTIKE